MCYTCEEGYDYAKGHAVGKEDLGERSQVNEVLVDIEIFGLDAGVFGVCLLELTRVGFEFIMLTETYQITNICLEHSHPHEYFAGSGAAAAAVALDISDQ